MSIKSSRLSAARNGLLCLEAPEQVIGDDSMPAAVRMKHPGREILAEVTEEPQAGALELLGILGPTNQLSSAA
jgi:hypothetical protein